jgi:hypothetical protein
LTPWEGTVKILKGKGYRVASAAAGDDTTRARFVRVEHDAETPRKRRRTQPKLPGFEAAFILEGRTKFGKSVQAPNDHILVSGHNNIKIGRTVRKGHLRGYWIFTLSLEERKTCPPSCGHWQNCYGNNMPFAKRVDHTHPDFYRYLEGAVERLVGTRGRVGVLIRLHALGDFFSVEYVEFWKRMLDAHATLSIFGYTAHAYETDIGRAVAKLNAYGDRRAVIRYSNGGYVALSTVSIGNAESCPPGAFVCPEQTGRTLGCDTCGACWSTRKNVAFLEH